MNGQVARPRQRSARSWRVREWPTDPTVAHLIFTDHLTVPDEATIVEALDRCVRSGARAVRTSALFPRAADVVIDTGFVPIDRLALLRRRLDPTASLPTPSHRVRPLRQWQHRAAAVVDRDAFGELWGNSARSLADIRTATPTHRARHVAHGRSLVGFAISGAAGHNGYLQRLATSPDHQRAGIARSLVIDALAWMSSRGLDSATVNTGVTNHAALALYEGLGFEMLAEELIIAEYRFER